MLTGEDKIMFREFQQWHTKIISLLARSSLLAKHTANGCSNWPDIGQSLGDIREVEEGAQLTPTSCDTGIKADPFRLGSVDIAMVELEQEPVSPRHSHVLAGNVKLSTKTDTTIEDPVSSEPGIDSESEGRCSNKRVMSVALVLAMVLFCTQVNALRPHTLQRLVTETYCYAQGGGYTMLVAMVDSSVSCVADKYLEGLSV